MPAGCALDVATRGPAARWTDELELAAVTVELIAVLNRNFVKANTKKGTYVEPPLTIPRPEALVDGKRRMASPAELAAFAGATGGIVRVVPKAPKGSSDDDRTVGR